MEIASLLVIALLVGRVIDQCFLVHCLVSSAPFAKTVFQTLLVSFACPSSQNFHLLGMKTAAISFGKQLQSPQSAISAYNSFHSGLRPSINSIFLALEPAFICFSLAIASSIEWNGS